MRIDEAHHHFARRSSSAWAKYADAFFWISFARRSSTTSPELADGGTLFLDEIGDLDPALQAELLRALQGGEIQRLGSARAQKVDVRVIAATNRDLDAALHDGRFRAPTSIIASASSPSTCPRCATAARTSRSSSGTSSSPVSAPSAAPSPPSPALMDALVAYHWPGNVR